MMKKVVSLFLVSLFCVMLNANAIAAAPVSDSEGTAYLPSGGEYTDENFYETDELQVFANGAIRVYPTAKGTSDSEASTELESALHLQRALGPLAGMLDNAGDVESYTITLLIIPYRLRKSLCKWRGFLLQMLARIYAAGCLRVRSLWSNI